MPTAPEIQQAVNDLYIDAGKLHQVVHGDADTVITTETGTVKSLANLQREFNLDAEAAVGDIETFRDEAEAARNEAVPAAATAVAAATAAESARDIAAGAQNYFATKAAGASATPTGQIFTSDEDGSLAWYVRTGSPPNYSLIDYPATRDFFAADAGASRVGTADGGNVQEVVDLLFQDSVTLSTFTAQVQAQNWTVGDAIFVPLWGGSRWTVRSEVILQNHFSGEPLQSSKVDFDDELHVQVPLAGGGTGVLECDLGSIRGYVTNELTRLYNLLFARISRKRSVTTVLTANAFGDSITYGQTGPALVGGDQINTGFGDGSKHEWSQISDPWPEALEDCLDRILGAGKASVTNKGYSGDLIGMAYKRHRQAAPTTLSFVCYGTNDCKYGSNNGVNPEYLFDVSHESGQYLYDRFTSAYRKFVYREVLRGSVPILAGPYVYLSLTGYDDTNTADGKMAALYRMAVKTVADEIGAGFSDWAQSVNSRPIDAMTHDGIHLTNDGARQVAVSFAAMLTGYGWRYATVIRGRTLLGSMPHIENMNGAAASNATDLAPVPNSNTLGKPFFTSANGADLVVDAEERFYPIYCDTDEVALLPVGYLSNGGTLTASLDMHVTSTFEVVQGKARLNTKRGAAQGEFLSYNATESYHNTSGGNAIINNPASSPLPPLIVQGRGWHMISLKSTGAAFVLSGIAADPDWAKTGAAVADPAAPTYAAPSAGSLIDTEARVAIAQLAVDNAALRTTVTTLLGRLRDRADIKQ